MVVGSNQLELAEAALSADRVDGHSDGAAVVVLAGQASSHVLSGHAEAVDEFRLTAALVAHRKAVCQLGGDNPGAADGSMASHEVLNVVGDSDFAVVLQVTWSAQTHCLVDCKARQDKGQSSRELEAEVDKVVESAAEGLDGSVADKTAEAALLLEVAGARRFQDSEREDGATMTWLRLLPVERCVTLSRMTAYDTMLKGARPPLKRGSSNELERL